MQLLYAFTLGTALVFGDTLAQGQTNYVANTANASSPGINNTLVGSGAGNTGMTGGSNTFLGFDAGRSTTDGQANVFIGSQAGRRNLSGVGNMFLGQQAGYDNVSGSYNVFVGNGAGLNAGGSGNTYIGDGSGLNNLGGSRNVSIGQYAGSYGRSNYGIDNVFIGYNARANGTGLTNATAIGAYAVVNQNNSVVLGNVANVAIGNSAPSTKLHITSDAVNTSGLRLENLTIGSPATVLNQNKFLTVDGAGNVILGSTNSSTRQAADNGLWERKGAFLTSTQNNAVVIGHEVSKTPVGYNLFVSKGILTERVKVAVPSTKDWSDNVFERGYDLKPLDQVEQYIRTNGHLPGVPSADEMVESGNDLHKTDAKLLEKIEELILYMIDLKKENQVLKQRLDTLMTTLTPAIKKAD